MYIYIYIYICVCVCVRARACYLPVYRSKLGQIWSLGDYLTNTEDHGPVPWIYIPATPTRATARGESHNPKLNQVANSGKDKNTAAMAASGKQLVKLVPDKFLTFHGTFH